jgi:hypothetical protein
VMSILITGLGPDSISISRTEILVKAL